MPKSTQPADPEKFNLLRLASPALSVWEICRWLVANADSLACPLATIRLLMSPSAKEKQKLTPIDLGEGKQLKRTNIEPADWTHFVTEAIDWRKEAATDPRSMTFFYYSGHGLERLGRPLITLADFTDPAAGGVLQRSCEVTANFVLGMAPSANRPDIARTQFYFVDACRETVMDYPGLANAPGTVWDPLPGIDDRATPMFMASYPGSIAQAIAGKKTDFCEALIKSLENGAENPDMNDPQQRWPVTSFTLNTALDNHFLEKKTGQYAPATGTIFKKVTLRWLTSPPEVEFRLVIRPDAAIGVTGLALERVGGGFRKDISPSAADHPYAVTSQAGIFQLTAKAAAGFADITDTQLINQERRNWPISMAVAPLAAPPAAPLPAPPAGDGMGG
ncbi:hypothetical protein [Mesorhizobium sp. M0036]|uniref:caspase family protein n=1 Tax=Mesorhizobium sp. M0036 TaxID=2956853 RepID=UPI003338350E